jgi:hypothetical protein
VSSGRRRRSTLSMGVIGDTVFIPGSPAMILPELLQEAELEVRDGPEFESEAVGFSSERRSIPHTDGRPEGRSLWR